MKNKINSFIAWGARFFRTLHREAAIDSARNVLAVVGVGTLLGDFAAMRTWFILCGLGILFFIWFADYQRHFVGESAEDSCARQLGALQQ